MIDLPYREAFANFSKAERQARKIPFVEIDYCREEDTVTITMSMGEAQNFISYVFGRERFQNAVAEAIAKNELGEE